MDRRPIEVRIDARARDARGEVPGVDREAFRAAMAEWASTVTIVAVRDGGGVHGLTVTSFFPVSAEPPLVAVSLGGNAAALPFLEEGVRFGVSFLAEGQERVASVLADVYPVGPPPFVPGGEVPLVEGCVLGLVCTVRSLTETESGATLVVARVEAVAAGGGEAPLLYHGRRYRSLADDHQGSQG